MKTNFAEVLRMHRSARLWRSFQSAAVGVRTILGMALIVTMPVHVAAQALDTTPPVLTAFDFTPKTIDTTAGAATVTVTFSGTDDLAGMYSFFVAINSPSGQHWQYAEAYCKPNCPPSGGFGFSQYGTEAGVWTVAYVSVEDAVGNRRTYFTADLVALGFPTQLLSTGAQYNFTGFFQPVASLPTMNVAKAGSAIPVKWSLGGYQGMDICAAGYPASGPIPSDPTQVTEAIEETVTAGNSSLNYDAGAGQYVYVWKTQKAWAGTSRQLVIKLKDGTYHRANFKFTK